MITVTDFDKMCQDIITHIGTKGYVMASTEEQGMKKLRDRDGVQLVAVYPDYSLVGESDVYRTDHQLLFFVVIREREAQDNQEELKQYQDAQDAILKLKKYLLGEDSDNPQYCRIFPNAEVESLSIDPEYNIFGGYLGWSLKVIV